MINTKENNHQVKYFRKIDKKAVEDVKSLKRPNNNDGSSCHSERPSREHQSTGFSEHLKKVVQKIVVNFSRRLY